MKFLITRSEPHASQLASRLKSMGIESIHTETMSIEPIPLSGESRSQLMNLDLFDYVVVVSANAAYILADHIDRLWPQLPVGIEWVAIGKASALKLSEEIAELPPSCIHTPDGIDSEALLNLPIFKQSLDGKKVLLVKGEGGRDLIQQTLTEQGASVTELPLYQRVPAYHNARIAQDFYHEGLDYIQIASGDGFLSLLALLNHNAAQKIRIDRNVRWIVPSERVAQLLISHGVNEAAILVSNGASNDALIEILTSQSV